MIRSLFKPEYVFRPRQLLRRIRRAVLGSDASQPLHLLPWGQPFRVNHLDDIGRQIDTLGVFDLVLTEAVWRLADAGETCIDAGTNIGYVTAVLAERVKPNGTVYSFEPHPQVFSELSTNVDLIRKRLVGVTVKSMHAALAEEAGARVLHVPGSFADNRGVAFVQGDHQGGSVEPNTIQVPGVTLDETVRDAAIGVLKIDVEGYELPVLRGASELLSARRIRDVIFEEHRAYPSDVTSLLESRGMRVFRLRRGFRGPQLLPGDSPLPRSKWEATSFLATREPDRAIDRFRKPGWNCLRGDTK